MIRTFKSKALAELWRKGRTPKLDAKLDKLILYAAGSSRRLCEAGGNERSRFRLSPAQRVPSAALFGPCQWTMVHHIRVSKVQMPIALTSNSTTKGVGWSMRQSATRTGCPTHPAHCYATKCSRPPAEKGRDCQSHRNFSAAPLRHFERERKPVSPGVAVRLGKLFGDGAGFGLECKLRMTHCMRNARKMSWNPDDQKCRLEFSALLLARHWPANRDNLAPNSSGVTECSFLSEKASLSRRYWSPRLSLLSQSVQFRFGSSQFRFERSDPACKRPRQARQLRSLCPDRGCPIRS